MTSSCSTGDTSFLAIGYAHGLIETRQRETGELLEYWNIETKDLVSLLFDSNDKLLAVTESGTRRNSFS